MIIALFLEVIIIGLIDLIIDEQNYLFIICWPFIILGGVFWFFGVRKVLREEDGLKNSEVDDIYTFSILTLILLPIVTSSLIYLILFFIFGHDFLFIIIGLSILIPSFIIFSI